VLGCAYRRAGEGAKVGGMESKNYLYLKLEKGETIAEVKALLKDADLELPFEEFMERYVRPAYKQLIAEQKYLLDHPRPAAAAAPHSDLPNPSHSRD
jgi:hypothetical protein